MSQNDVLSIALQDKYKLSYEQEQEHNHSRNLLSTFQDGLSIALQDILN